MSGMEKKLIAGFRCENDAMKNRYWIDKDKKNVDCAEKNEKRLSKW